MSSLTLTRRPDGIAVLSISNPDKPVNTLDLELFVELNGVLDGLEKNPPKALLLVSGKPGQFIAGADVKKISALLGDPRAAEMAGSGRDAFTRFSKLPFPTAALITGVAPGGGLEWPLACDLILAADEPSIRIGLPEVRLGILPGWGGTARLPRRVGLMGALDLILQGKLLDAQRAFRVGMIDGVVPINQLETEALRRFAANNWQKPAAPSPRGGLKALLLENNPLGRSFVLGQAAKAVAKTTGGHYPAPTQILAALRAGYGQPLEVALREEGNALKPLLASPVAGNLINIFLQSEAAKKNPFAPEGEKVEPPQRVMVIGAGVMGAGIAVALLQAGREVWLKEVAEGPLLKGVAEVEKWLAKDAKRRRSPPALAREVRARLVPTLEDAALANCDLVIEAVVEKMEVKKTVFAACEARLRPDALLATNTSSLPVTQMQAGTKNPGRIAGLHFFNPAPLMPLVEIIRGEQTDDKSLAKLHALVVKMGKTPVVVKDGPGFLVNRLLAFYLNEAAALLSAGVPIPVLDRALKQFGMPMGPAELMDVVGLDVAAHAGGVMAAAWPDRAKVPELLKLMVEEKRLGKKMGRGFYAWEGEKKTEPLAVPKAATLTQMPTADALVERCLYPLINEAATCLADRVVENAAALDLAMIFGTGFAPFRGGPLRWADSVGTDQIIASLEALAKTHGPHLAPSPALKAMAGKKFHG